MRQFEIFWDDLTTDAQDRLKEFEGIEEPEQGNYDAFPVTVLFRDVELDDESEVQDGSSHG